MTCNLNKDNETVGNRFDPSSRDSRRNVRSPFFFFNELIKYLLTHTINSMILLRGVGAFKHQKWFDRVEERKKERKKGEIGK